MAEQADKGRDGPPPSTAALEAARAFLLALVAGVRTATLTPEGPALDESIATVHGAAQRLFQATGGFSLRLVEGAALLNGARLPFDGGSYGQLLRDRLAARGLARLGMKKAPSVGAIRKLIEIFVEVPGDPTGPLSEADAEPSVQQALPRSLSDISSLPEGDEPVSTTELPIVANPEDGQAAATVFARLVLALREQRTYISESRESATALLPAFRHPTSHAAIMLVELTREHLAPLLRLVLLVPETQRPESRRAMITIVAAAIGRALRVPERMLLDIALAALVADVGAAAQEGDADQAKTARAASIARVLGEDASRPATQTRAFIVAELDPPEDEAPSRPPHLFSRIVAVATAFVDLVAPQQGDPVPAREALTALHQRAGDRVDPAVLDVLSFILLGEPRGESTAPRIEPSALMPAEPDPSPGPDGSGHAAVVLAQGQRETVRGATNKIRLPWLNKRRDRPPEAGDESPPVPASAPSAEEPSE